MGRQAGCHLILRDSRVSRTHARIVAEGSDYYVEDAGSRHGFFVNGQRVQRHCLTSGDRLDFGVPDGYTLIFHFAGEEIARALNALPASAGLGKLRALVEVARVMQSSLSTLDFLAAVVDAALEVTGCERGFLLLAANGVLELKIARDRQRGAIEFSQMPVPPEAILSALNLRRELWSVEIPLEAGAGVCLPLVRIRPGDSDKTCVLMTGAETTGALFLEAGSAGADLSTGSRELLQTLALEASTILENAHLLEQERAGRRMEEELEIARRIQLGLQPRSLPQSGWFRAAGAGIPSSQVGGDYYDVRLLPPDAWCAIVADVSGKGVSSALLASLLQGAFLAASGELLETDNLLSRANRFLCERTVEEKYATIFYCTLDATGLLKYANAGHCAPILVSREGRLRSLAPTGLPAGLMEDAAYTVESVRLEPGDKVVIYSDGITEAQDSEERHFGVPRLRRLVRAGAGLGCEQLVGEILAATRTFTGELEQADDITVLVLEYSP
jgi:serine phosphatase RsbU (regulator of sigma subunit)